MLNILLIRVRNAVCLLALGVLIGQYVQPIPLVPREGGYSLSDRLAMNQAFVDAESFAMPDEGK